MQAAEADKAAAEKPAAEAEAKRKVLGDLQPLMRDIYMYDVYWV